MEAFVGGWVVCGCPASLMCVVCVWPASLWGLEVGHEGLCVCGLCRLFVPWEDGVVVVGGMCAHCT